MLNDEGWHVAQGDKAVGPVSLDALRQWIAQGKVTAADRVWQDGMTDWQEAARVPGLIAGPVPPPLPPMPPIGMPYATQYSQPAPEDIGQNAGIRMLIPVGRSGWAIAAGYLGLMSILGIFGPFALITGIIAVRDIKKHPQRHGMGRAVFGIVMGLIGTALFCFMIVALVMEATRR